MANTQNEYENAFQSWLTDNRAKYIPIDQHKRSVFSNSKIKSFDFLLYPDKTKDTPNKPDVIIAEVKGRKFKGKSLIGLKSIQSWVTIEDIKGLQIWQRILSASHPSGKIITTPAFIFAYKFDNIDVETDGIEPYDYADNKFVFYIIKLDDYKEFMKPRSQKWQTVTLPAEKYRQIALNAKKFLFG